MTACQDGSSMRNKNTYLTGDKLKHLIETGVVVILRDDDDEIEYRFNERNVRWIERKDTRGLAKAVDEWRRSACYWHYKAKMAEHWKQAQQEAKGE